MNTLIGIALVWLDDHDSPSGPFIVAPLVQGAQWIVFSRLGLGRVSLLEREAQRTIALARCRSAATLRMAGRIFPGSLIAERRGAYGRPDELMSTTGSGLVSFAWRPPVNLIFRFFCHGVVRRRRSAHSYQPFRCLSHCAQQERRTPCSWRQDPVDHWCSESDLGGRLKKP